MLKTILQGPPYLIKVEFDKTSNGFIVILPIASKDDPPCITSLVCKLEPKDIADELHWCFWFMIDIDYFSGAKKSFQTQDRERVKDFIPEHVMKRLFMQVVREAALKLADYVKPHFIYGVTKETRPTEKQLGKYHMLISSLQKSHGYVVHRKGTNADDTAFWVLRRTAAKRVSRSAGKK